MNTSSTSPEAIAALVDSLESHEGAMSDRERQLCSTLLYGLAAAGRLVGVSSSGDLPDFDFESASESERWAYDQGYEHGWGERDREATPPPAVDSLDGIRRRIAALVAELDELIAKDAAAPVSEARFEGGTR